MKTDMKLSRSVDPKYALTGRTHTQTLVGRGLGLALAMFLLVMAVGFVNGRVGSRAPASYTDLERSVRALEGELELTRQSLDRAETLLDLSARFGVPADATTRIYDIALSEGIDPELAFRLVAVESGFDSTAVSPVGAIGWAQVMLETARYFDPEITAAELFDAETNLRFGLRHLGYLLRTYGDRADIALTAYNRGPSRVAELISMGADPLNGYASAVMDGYRPIE